MRPGPQLDQQPRGDSACPAQSPLAMNNNVEPAAQSRTKPRSMARPALLEISVRHRYIGDRQVDPLQVAGGALLRDCLYLKRLDLVVLDQRHQNHRAKVHNRIKVEPEFAVPCARRRAGLLLARAERDANGPLVRR